MDVTAEAKHCYDVYLSFRGEDTRYTFTGFLYDALRRKGLNAFIDDAGLKRGEQISDSLVKAIEESKISMIIFSKNYAFSAWCLDELVKILETMKMKGNQQVWPIFYKVERSDVMYQRNSYAQAMAAHENRFGNDLVNKWRSALSEAANLTGWHLQTGHEYKFIQSIVEKAAALLHREQIYVDEHLIGIQSHIEVVKSLLAVESGDTVCMVGIHGMGGIGKTALARAVYNLICDRFECAIFLGDVRERSNRFMGTIHLQKELLSRLFEGENFVLGSVNEGATILKNRFHLRRVLLVLDDVDNKDQLKKLAGDCNWFRPGSRIIITTRDKHVLVVHHVEKLYEMKQLNNHEALQLFCWNAFKMGQPATGYEDLSNRAVHYAKGHPLALKVMGNSLVGRSVEEWKSVLATYESIPYRGIYDTLKISYDSLDENVKDVFLDIAYFFNQESVDYVEKLLGQYSFSAAHDIATLVDKSLLNINNYGQLWMHDLVRGMGREIVRQAAPENPSKRSRLCFHKDVVRALTENSGSRNIEGIILDPPEREEVKWSGTAFKKMKTLRILIIRNAQFFSGPKFLPDSLRLLEWNGYPSESLPNIPKNAVVLSLPDSNLRLETETPLPKLQYLTYLNLSDCQFITYMPDVSEVPNLRKLRLDGCINLVAVHPSVGFLDHLGFLSASHCIKLRNFLPSICLPSLKYLDLHLTGIELFPDIVGVMDKLLYISLEYTCIKELPYSIVNLTGLEYLQLQYCDSLRDLPSALFMLPNIEELWLHGSPQVLESFRRFRDSHVGVGTVRPNLRRLYFLGGGLTDEDLHVIVSCFPNLEELHVPSNYFASLPAGINESANLRVLDVSRCKKLQEIPELPLSKKVVATYCPLLTSETTRLLLSQLLCTIGLESRTLSINYCHSDGEILTSGSQADNSHHKQGQIFSANTIKEQVQKYQAF